MDAHIVHRGGVMLAQYNSLTHQYDATDDTGAVLASGWTHADALRAAGFDVVCDAGPDWDDTPTDGPGTDSPETGPSEVYVASLVAHVADTYAALFPAAPPVAPVAPSCDVRGCESTRALRSVLIAHRYPVTLCAGHARAVRR